ncbi:19400_t:CDS:2, partial [Racocetra persica]
LHYLSDEEAERKTENETRLKYSGGRLLDSHLNELVVYLAKEYEESLTKIQHYNLLNIHKELSYNVKNKTEDELIAMIQRSYLFETFKGENNKSKDYKDENNRESDDDLVIPNHQIVVFVINNIVDLHYQAFNQVENLYIFNEDNNNSDVAMNEDHEFNLEEL